MRKFGNRLHNDVSVLRNVPSEMVKMVNLMLQVFFFYHSKKMYLYFTQYIETTPTYNQYENDRQELTLFFLD